MLTYKADEDTMDGVAYTNVDAEMQSDDNDEKVSRFFSSTTTRNIMAGFMAMTVIGIVVATLSATGGSSELPAVTPSSAPNSPGGADDPAHFATNVSPYALSLHTYSSFSSQVMNKLFVQQHVSAQKVNTEACIYDMGRIDYLFNQFTKVIQVIHRFIHFLPYTSSWHQPS